MTNNENNNKISRRKALSLLGLGAVITQFPIGCTGLRSEEDSSEGEPTHYKKIAEISKMIESRQITSVELTQAILDRIAVVDKSLNSYITVMRQSALETARESDAELAAGNYRGPLHGVPVAVKDLLYTVNAPTTGGHAFRRDSIPSYNATVVNRLKDAGAVLLGKLNLTEGTMAGYHKDFNIPVNPWGPYEPGESSSGPGVATAAGLCFGSIGTDTGGSIRLPALVNGIVGLKPTYGLVSRHGVLPLAESMDHVGPMTRSVEDAAIMLGAIADYDPKDSTSLNVDIPDKTGPGATRYATLGIRELSNLCQYCAAGSGFRDGRDGPCRAYLVVRMARPAVCSVDGNCEYGKSRADRKSYRRPFCRSVLPAFDRKRYRKRSHPLRHSDHVSCSADFPDGNRRGSDENEAAHPGLASGGHFPFADHLGFSAGSSGGTSDRLAIPDDKNSAGRCR